MGGNNKVKQYKNTIPPKKKKKNKEKETKQTVHHFCFYNCSLLQT